MKRKRGCDEGEKREEEEEGLYGTHPVCELASNKTQGRRKNAITHDAERKNQGDTNTPHHTLSPTSHSQRDLSNFKYYK